MRRTQQAEGHQKTSFPVDLQFWQTGPPFLRLRFSPLHLVVI